MAKFRVIHLATECEYMEFHSFNFLKYYKFINFQLIYRRRFELVSLKGKLEFVCSAYLYLGAFSLLIVINLLLMFLNECS